MGGGPRVVVSTAAFHARVRGSVPDLGSLKETKMFLPHPRVKVSIVGSLRDREVACSASDRQGSNFESCVWRAVSSHHPQEVLLAQFSLYVHKGGLKPDSYIYMQGIHKVCFFLPSYLSLYDFDSVKIQQRVCSIASPLTAVVHHFQSYWAKVCLLFEECSWYHRELEGRINNTTRSSLHSWDIPKCSGSFYTLQFVSERRLSDYIFNDFVPNRFKVWCEGWAGFKLFRIFSRSDASLLMRASVESLCWALVV